MKHHFLPFLPLLLWLPCCAQQSFEEKMKCLYEGTVPLIPSAELATKEEAIILDIRSEKEYAVSHIQGARLISYDRFRKSDVKEIAKDKEVIVYCSVGYRSERIGERLQEMGYTNVKNLYGGIFDWKNQGYEVVTNENNPTDSVHTYNEDWSQWLYDGIKVYE